MDIISETGKDKEFDCAIVTDSVAVSLSLVKPECPSNELTYEQIKTMYDDHQFEFVFGTDPGVHTWNGTVRKHIRTGIEAQ